MLDANGIRSAENLWFKSYISNSKHCVEIWVEYQEYFRKLYGWLKGN